jgi:hypothetical protein
MRNDDTTTEKRPTLHTAHGRTSESMSERVGDGRVRARVAVSTMAQQSL